MNNKFRFIADTMIPPLSQEEAFKLFDEAQKMFCHKEHTIRILTTKNRDLRLIDRQHWQYNPSFTTSHS
jgi:hypothetical protein